MNDEKSPLFEKTVLWVEDDKFLANILVRKFESVGCNMVQLNSAEEAFAFVRHTTPRLILLDILLAGMNGFEILQKIKADPNLKEIPVMMLSNTSQPADIERAKILGADKFIVKATSSTDDILREAASLVK